MLYHYTSLDSFIAIVESGTLWASDQQFLNDGRELTHALEIISDALDRIEPERGEPKFLKRVRQSLLKMGAGSVFVASFSQNGDLLSQWRAYCPPGRGVSIGFDEKRLEETCARQRFRLVQCTYDQSSHALTADELVRELFDQFEELEDDPDTDYQADCGELISVFSVDVDRCASTMKDPAFREECEWRVVRSAGRASRYEDRYRAGRSFIVPYVPFELPLDEHGKLGIGEVVVGPAPHPELSRRAIRQMLASRRISFDERLVRVSSVPYRAW